MTTPTIEKILKILKKEIQKWQVPAVGQIADEPGEPATKAPAGKRAFLVLVSTILSLRTKDAVTIGASRRLLGRASTPREIARLSATEIEKLIYPVGFYRTKARNLRQICKILLDQYDGRVPGTLEELLKLPGVGRKTANLVVTVGYDDYGICVDTHVHRISNLWGYVTTRTPEETEFALRARLPKKDWKTFNDILVTFGQNLCVPVSPWCNRCPVKKYCEKVGLRRSR